MNLNVKLEFYKYLSKGITVLVAKQVDEQEGLEIWCKPRGFYSVRNGIVRPFDDDCQHISEDVFAQNIAFAFKSIADSIGMDLIND